MRSRNLLGLLSLCAIIILFTRPSNAQVRINEVGYDGVEYNGSARWVELWNTGDAAVDVSSFWLCNFPSYMQISTLTVLDGATTIPAGGNLVVAFDALGNGDGEVGLYTTNTFGDSNAMLDYVQYGSAGHMRESVAVAAGVWDSGTFVSPADAAQSLAFVGYGATSSDRWRSSDPTPGMSNGTDPDTAPEASIDRFSEAAGTLMVRDDSNGLPGPNEPIDFDSGEPFITKGLGPHGEFVQYYNFDVQPTETAPIFALFREGEEMPVEGQLNIVGVIPGDEGYNDFWHVHKVTVPTDYVVNSITNVSQIMDAGLPIEKTNIIVNCPIVPDGSTAEMRLAGGATGLTRGWYMGQVVYYFEFAEHPLRVDPPAEGHAMVPVSPIYVSFNINPGEEGGGPPSGFMTEENSAQTHNVVATIPGDDTYSPLWVVNIYDNADFESVGDLTTAQAATILATGAALVNCPVVAMAGTDPDTAPEASIDRFSEEAGTLMVRDDSNGLPGPNEPIDFDSGEPFITKGLGPHGEFVQYYNFDVQPTETAPIFALFREGEETPVEGQLNIVGVIPGDEGYNDFWHVHKVTVPANYIANTYTSVSQLMAAELPIEKTNIIVNCPIVPDGSTAGMRLGKASTGLTRGWYMGQVVYYFEFAEHPLRVDPPAEGHAMVPVSPIYVSFNINPGEDGGGPPSGFMAEENSAQTHNVIATIPGDETYSPLWVVNIYDNADFESVGDLATAQAATILAAGAALVNCPVVAMAGTDPDTAPEASIDRFSEEAGTLMVRDDSNGLPDPNEPIDFDSGEPFITQGLGPDGSMVEYYNFDVQPTETAPIFALFREGEETPVEGQLNIVGVIPGDEGYNDFWHVHKVTVPANYVANTYTSVGQLMAANLPTERTNLVVNCPIVPEGSTAEKRFAEGANGLTRGWYEGQVVYYFEFAEHPLRVDPPAEGHAMVPVSPIYVSFNINPGEEGGGPPSGFMTEENSTQTHNVVATLPGDETYSPLWVVNIYDNADFDAVHDLATAQSATLLAAGAALVNCPIVTAPTATSVEYQGNEQPRNFALHGNYPNPFNPQTTIRFELAQAGRVTLAVFDLLGKKVVQLIDDERQTDGVHEVTWNGRDAIGRPVGSGMYLYRFTVDGVLSASRVMTLLK